MDLISDLLQSVLDHYVPVQLESPYGSDNIVTVYHNERYLQECIRDCFERQEAPFASHRMYTEALDDRIPKERAMGIGAGLIWARFAKRRVVYLDYGLSIGMKKGIAHARQIEQPIELRYILPVGERVPHEPIEV